MDKIYETHCPDFYVGGVFIEDTWRGRFHATTNELLEYAITSEDVGDGELILIDHMVEAQLIYSNWWAKVQK